MLKVVTSKKVEGPEQSLEVHQLRRFNVIQMYYIHQDRTSRMGTSVGWNPLV